MYNQRNGGFHKGGRGQGERTWDRGGEDRPMFKATCASCGDSCEVPFKPNGSKPIYCRDCFKKEGGGNDRPMRMDGGHDRPMRMESGDRQLFPATCGTCGDRCEVPFRPDGSRPIFCRNCFGKRSQEQGSAPRSFGGAPSQPSQGGVDMRAELKSLNSKLDRIMSALNVSIAPKAAVPSGIPTFAKTGEATPSPKAAKLEAPKVEAKADAEAKPEAKAEAKADKKAKVAKPAAKKAGAKKKR